MLFAVFISEIFLQVKMLNDCRSEPGRRRNSGNRQLEARNGSVEELRELWL